MTQTLLYEFAHFSNDVLGYWPSILFPFLLVAVLAAWQIKIMSFNLTIFAAFFMIFPALTPAATQLLGFKYFTMLNYDLQQDLALKASAVMLISLFTSFFILGAMLPNNVRGLERRERILLGKAPLIILLSILFVLAFFFLESGSIINNKYGDVKHAGQAPYSSLVNQFINACIATFLCYLGGRSRRRMILIFYVSMIILLLVISRRTLAIALVILVAYSFGSGSLTVKQVILLCLTFILLVFIGEARSVGIMNYLQGIRSASSLEIFFSLPGGASNVFVGSMGVIHMLGRDVISFPETIPVLLWPVEVYESTIYESHNYQYNGGMHIANIFYWNFGIIGVSLGGSFLGWLTARVHLIVSRINKDLSGTYPAMLSFAYILTLPNSIWYNPVGLIKLTLAVTFGFMALTVIKRATRPLSSGGNLIGETIAHR